MKSIPKHNQSILDVSIEKTGSIDAFIDILQKNGLESLHVPKATLIDTLGVTNKNVVEFFKQTNSPASGGESDYSFIPPVDTPVQLPVNDDNWVRNPEWLDIDELDGSEDKLVGIMAVFPYGANKQTFRISCSGGITIDWGDGSITSHSSSIYAHHTYDFNSLPASSQTSEGYRQAKITVTATSPGSPFDGIFYWRYSAVSNWLDVNVYVPNTTHWVGYGLSPYLERFRFAIETPSVAMNTQFYKCIKLEVLEIDWSKPTTVSNFLYFTNFKKMGDINLLNSSVAKVFGDRNFSLLEVGNITSNSISAGPLSYTNGIKKIGHISLPNTTTLQQLLMECQDLQGNITIYAPNATNGYMLARSCVKLKKIYIDAPLENCNQLIYSSYFIEELTLTDASNVNDTANMLVGVISLKKLRLPGIKIGFTMYGLDIDAPNMVILFNDLADLTALPTQTITITLTPASATLTATERSIATNKNWTIIG